MVICRSELPDGTWKELPEMAYVDNAVGRRIDVAAVLARERLFIHGAHTGVGPVTDIYHAVAYRYAARSLSAFATLGFEFLCRKAGDLTETDA